MCQFLNILRVPRGVFAWGPLVQRLKHTQGTLKTFKTWHTCINAILAWTRGSQALCCIRPLVGMLDLQVIPAPNQGSPFPDDRRNSGIYIVEQTLKSTSLGFSTNRLCSCWGCLFACYIWWPVVGWWQLPNRSYLSVTQGSPRPSFEVKLIRGDSNVLFVECLMMICKWG